MTELELLTLVRRDPVNAAILDRPPGSAARPGLYRVRVDSYRRC